MFEWRFVLFIPIFRCVFRVHFNSISHSVCLTFFVQFRLSLCVKLFFLFLFGVSFTFFPFVCSCFYRSSRSLFAMMFAQCVAMNEIEISFQFLAGNGIREPNTSWKWISLHSLNNSSSNGDPFVYIANIMWYGNCFKWNWFDALEMIEKFRVTELIKSFINRKRENKECQSFSIESMNWNWIGRLPIHKEVLSLLLRIYFDWTKKKARKSENKKTAPKWKENTRIIQIERH